MPDNQQTMPASHPVSSVFTMPEPSLAALELSLWDGIAQAVVDRHAGWHTMTVGTVGPQGEPDLRTVVLRGCEPSRRSLRFHTDARAPKIAALRANPAVAVLFYDPASKVQLRLQGRAEILTEGEPVDRAWGATALMSRRCYLAVSAPGAPADAPISGLPPGLDLRAPSAAESEAGRPNFATVTVTAETGDLLYLAARGHKRAQFAWGADWALVSARWCAP